MRIVTCTTHFMIAIVTGVMFALPASGQVFFDEQKILAGDGASGDLFGWSIAADNNTLVVASVHETANGIDAGAVYLFRVDTGVLIAKLAPNDGNQRDNFGFSVAIDNGLVIIGAYLDDDDGADSGSVYIYDANTGVQLFKLHANDATAGDNFGIAVAIDNGIAVIGASRDNDNGTRSGSAYVFDANTGMQLTKLLANDGSPEDQFGLAVAVQDGIAAVGVPNDDDNGSQSGSVYLFDAISGIQLSKLTPVDGSASNNFGNAIAIDNGIVVIGARFENENVANAGAAYLFDTESGVQVFKLIASDGASNDFFGSSVDIQDGIVGVGAYREAFNGTGSGAAYSFDANTGLQMFKHIPADGEVNDFFGYSIAIDTGVLFAGATQNDDSGLDSGSVYSFPQLSLSCSADFNGDGVLNFFDVSAFLAAFSAGCP